MKILRGVCVAFFLATNACRAFSLLGPYEDWMQLTNGFGYAGDIGGPMQIDAEYRWNVPVVTYAFDQSFLDYFGSNGVAAVEKAIQILNDLPPASHINLSNYPMASVRWNYDAQNQGLLDLKSQTLYLLLEQLGLTQPVRSIFSPRSYYFTNGNLAPILTRRNFDPVSLLPSDCVNYSCFATNQFSIYTNGASIYVSGWPELVTPFGNLFPSILGSLYTPGAAIYPGVFYDGLTYDDVGGVRYLLHTNNFNYEILLPTVHGSGANTSSFVNLAFRGGVDKITFVRQGYDSLLEQLSVPFTNQYVDRFLTNNTVVEQQLERIAIKPDFLFSAKTPESPVFYQFLERTSTCNWTNLASINGGENGPGLIKPPINIVFFTLVSLFQSGDDFPSDYTSLDESRWGSFDSSNNQLIRYPLGLALQETNLTVHLELLSNGIGAICDRDWHLISQIGNRIAVQTSTNLMDWLTLTTVTNRGVPIYWRHILGNQSQRYFRISPL